MSGNAENNDSSVVNILDEMLEETLEDLGGEAEGDGDSFQHFIHNVRKSMVQSISEDDASATNKQQLADTAKEGISNQEFDDPGRGGMEPDADGRLKEEGMDSLDKDPKGIEQQLAGQTVTTAFNGNTPVGSLDLDNAISKEEEGQYDTTCSKVSTADDDDNISKLSISSASLESDEDDVERRHKGRTSDKDASQEKKHDATRLTNILKDARFFLMKSDNMENIELSKSKGVWSTLLSNESRINRAFRESSNVLLIFSVKKSGKFSGFARLKTGSQRNVPQPEVNWVLPPGLSRKVLGAVFSVEWISKNDLPFVKTQHLFNSLNDGKPVKVGRDGQEIEPHVASELCRLFHMDAGGSPRAGSMMMPKMGVKGRGEGSFRDRRRDARDRPPPLFGNSWSLENRRGTRRQRYPNVEEDFVSQSKRARGGYQVYKDDRTPGYFDRTMAEQRSTHRYAREGNYSGISTEVYSDYVVWDYHHRPPPIAPLPYPPPPPFDSLPPPHRYYQLPEFISRFRSTGHSHRGRGPYGEYFSEYRRRPSNKTEKKSTRP